MPRYALLMVSLLLACRETGTPPTQPEPVVQPDAAAAASEDDPGTPGPAKLVVLRVVEDSVSVDGTVVAQARPPAAPGVLSDALQPTYALAPLAEALADFKKPPTAPVLVVGPKTPLSHIRAVMASYGGFLRLVVDDQPATASVDADSGVMLSIRSADSAGPVIRPRGEALRVWVNDRPATDAVPVGTLASALSSIEWEPAQGIAIDLPDPRPASELWDAAQALHQIDASRMDISLALDLAPCLTPPEDMSCIPGGPVIVGADDGPSEERPRRELLISTFYIDRHEVTIEQYDACHDDLGCKVRINGYQGIMKPFIGPDQPAMPMDFRRAQSYCAWAGKRLPTEWEWEKAARGPDGSIYPWGDEEPSCDKTIYRACAPWKCTPYPGSLGNRWDCSEHATKPVGSFPPGHHDLYEMAGNGYEWTNSAGVETIEECGDACQGRDPRGPCDGAFPCKGLRILKGGSWYWPKGRLKGSHRRVEKIKTGSHRLGMRCATDQPFLTNFPPRVLTEKREALPLPEPPEEGELAIFTGVKDDPVADKKICGSKIREGWHPSQSDGGRSELNCRDPFSYLMTNEPRGYVWKRYIADLGGAYVGIGSDQNFNYIAAARSRWAWVVDYDPRVVKNHRRIRALILAAETPDEFVKLFTPEKQNKAASIIVEAYPDDPDIKQLRWGYIATRDELLAYFTKQRKRRGSGKGAGFGWLRNEENYRYIRTLYQQGRIRIVAGDLLRDGAMQSIGEAARSLKVPVRIYYTSNAPTAWGGKVTDEYRRNVLALPFDEWSVVLRTTDGGGSLRQKTKWHHNVQWGWHMQERLQWAGFDTVWKVIEGRIPGDDNALTILGLPGSGTD